MATTTTSPSFSKKNMSITQTYFLAHKARAKLSREAARHDHHLRFLVGHANLLDSLMVDLADAEREQESWFNQSVSGATKTAAEERHIRWADSVEEPEEDWDAEDADSDSSSDSDSDFDDEEDVDMADSAPLRRPTSYKSFAEEDMEYSDDEEEEEDFAQLTLTRSPSHSASPPELDHDSDSSEDEQMPPSPPNAPLPAFSEKESSYATEFYESRQDFAQVYIPERSPARLISAISVY